ncbi:MAG TPA: VWA domain-containing protein [Thermoanaerobaculaceae bacterium]|nr:VWA domain-containing protein [Thermoanaerobaculaceae bacterium]
MMLGLIVAAAAAAAPPLALRVEIQPLGRGPQGTVMGIVIQVAPEDKARAGERLRVGVSLLQGGNVVDRGEAVVSLEQDGSAMLYREWPPGEGEVRVAVASLEGTATGGWLGKVVVPIETTPFEPTAGAAPDALALAPMAPASGVVHFRPPVRSGGIEAIQLEVDVPEGTQRVEFYQDTQMLYQRQRPPWTVSVPLGQIAKRTTVKAVAYGKDGSFLGEDAVVLNAPANQLPVEILLGPELAGAKARQVTVSVGGAVGITEVVLRADDEAVARWTACPCVVQLPVETFKKTKVLSADAKNRDGVTGGAIRVLGTTGYTESVKVEVVELPVTVFDREGKLVTGLGRDAFRVFEDGKEVPLEAFATTEELPLALGILVDTSGSMLQEFPEVRQAVAGFGSRLLRPGDKYFLMTFSFEPRTEVEWAGDPEGLVGALERVTPEGGTALFDAVVRALERFRGRRGRSALVLLSDGDDNSSRTSWDVTLRYVRTARVPIFTIGYRISKLDFLVRDRLKELARATGAEVFYAPKKSDLADVYKRIDEQLRAQYLLTYRSPSNSPSDQFRTVKVEVKGEGLSVRTIAGYFPSQ